MNKESIVLFCFVLFCSILILNIVLTCLPFFYLYLYLYLYCYEIEIVNKVNSLLEDIFIPS